MKWRAEFLCVNGSDCGWGRTGNTQAISGIAAETINEALYKAQQIKPGGWIVTKIEPTEQFVIYKAEIKE